MFKTERKIYFCFLKHIITRLLRVSFLFLVLTCAYSLRREEYKESQIRVFPNFNARYALMGYSLPVSDSILIKLLVNFGFCENQEVDPRKQNQGKNIDIILTANIYGSRCHKGWFFQWVDFMTELDPRFKSPYSTFGTILSVLVDDREGARLIFEKGLKRFPNDWVLNYRAAYHYLYEMQDAEKAAELMIRSYKNGGPHFLAALAAQLYTRSGKAAFAKTFLLEFIQENPDSIHIDQIRKRLQEIQ